MRFEKLLALSLRVHAQRPDALVHCPRATFAGAKTARHGTAPRGPCEFNDVNRPPPRRPVRAPGPPVSMPFAFFREVEQARRKHMSASPIAEREMRFLFTFALCGLAGAIALHALARLLTCCCDAACGALPLALASADGSGGRGDDDPEAPRPTEEDECDGNNDAMSESDHAEHGSDASEPPPYSSVAWI